MTALVKAGAKVNARNETRDEKGWTSLHYAARDNETPAIVTALVKAGANVNARNEDGWTPLHQAAAFNEIPEIVTALLKTEAKLWAGKSSMNLGS